MPLRQQKVITHSVTVRAQKKGKLQYEQILSLDPEAPAEAAMLDCVPASLNTHAQSTTVPKRHTLFSRFISLTQLSLMRMETKSINFA